ncbi:plant virulence effector HPE1-like domain-containing protein [Rhizobium daejeonense]
MRNLVLTSILLAAAAPAHASSIEVVGPQAAKGNSIIVMSCANCPAPQEVQVKRSYVVPHVAGGKQSAEIIEVNGEKKLKRTEAWMGGSPVVFMSKAEGWATDGSVVTAAGPQEDGIDAQATTAAVPVAAPAPAATAGMTGPSEPKPLDVTTFDLRLK